VPKSAGYDDFRSQVSRIGQFWAGDCFTRRSLQQVAVDVPTHPSPTAATDAAVSGHALGNKEGQCGKRILVADDDAGHVTLIKRALRHGQIDCAVDAVGNGMEVIEYLFPNAHSSRPAGQMPDLILLDLNMPKMNGRQVLQTLRNVHSQEKSHLPPVVVLTSSDEDSDINDSYRLGAQSFIRKPTDHHRFAVAVQQTTQYWLGLNKSASETSPVGPSLRVPR
jgi:two-component system response regulator